VNVVDIILGNILRVFSVTMSIIFFVSFTMVCIPNQQSVDSCSAIPTYFVSRFHNLSPCWFCGEHNIIVTM